MNADPQNPDRRSRARKQVAVDLRLKAPTLHLPLLSRTVDMSPASAFIRSARPLDVGTTVTVEFDRGRAKNPLALEAEVVRVGTTAEGRPGGFAVRFLGVGQLEETLLDELIAGITRPNGDES